MTITRTTPLDSLPEFLTIAECAAYLHLARTTTYALAQRGELRAVRFGKLLRVPRAALAALAEQQEPVSAMSGNPSS